ncbi:glycosyltransferase family 2 protein [Thiolapillus sp.]
MNAKTPPSHQPLKLGIVIPCHNESGNLHRLLEELHRYLADIDMEQEILLVDDGSTDDTWRTIESLAGQHEHIRGLRLSRNFGKEAAIAAGLEHVRGDAIILMDADLQHPPELIPRMLEIWQREEVDLVEAVKQHRGEEHPVKGLFSRSFYHLFRRLSGLEIDNASDFKLMSRRALESWRQLPERNLFFRGMSAWVGFSRATIPFSVPARQQGHSSWRARSLFQLAIKALTAYSSAPLHLVTLGALLFSLLTLVLGLQTLYNYFSGNAVSGFTTVILLILILGTFVLAGLSIIGEYLARIYDEIKQRPRYLIEADTGNLPEVSTRATSSTPG